MLVFSFSEVICPAPHIENGFVPVNIQEYKEHDILRFGCDPKHKSINVLPSKCTKRGLKAEWSPTPGCERKYKLRIHV